MERSKVTHRSGSCYLSWSGFKALNNSSQVCPVVNPLSCSKPFLGPAPGVTFQKNMATPSAPLSVSSQSTDLSQRTRSAPEEQSHKADISQVITLSPEFQRGLSSGSPQCPGWWVSCFIWSGSEAWMKHCPHHTPSADFTHPPWLLISWLHPHSQHNIHRSLDQK